MEFPNPVEEAPNAQPISTPEEAFIISMDAERGEELARKVKKAFGLREAHVILGSNGSNSSLPLYTRYLLEHGRSDQLQIGNRAMIGCLQSHIRVWHKIKDWAYVFEEDTRLHENSLNNCVDAFTRCTRQTVVSAFFDAGLLHAIVTWFRRMAVRGSIRRDLR